MKRSAAADNIIRAVVLAAVLVILMIPAYYSDRVYAYFPFFAVLILTGASVLLTLAVRRRIRFESDHGDSECERGMSVPLSMDIVNDSRLICPRAVAFIYITDVLGGTDSVTPAAFTMAARGASDFSFDIRMDHIGEYKAGIRSVELYDFLGIFRFPLDISEELSVAVMPRKRDDLEFELSEQSISESMDQKAAVVNDGFDYSGVREYAMGDSMKRIHWKISAHSPHYMTKLTETSMRNDLSIIIDPAAPVTDRETLACLYDTVMETALAAVRTAEHGETDYQVFFKGKDGTVESMVPKSDEDEKLLVRHAAVISPIVGEDEINGPAVMREEAMVSGGSSNLILVTSCIYEELTDELIAARQFGRNIHLVYVIEHGLDSRSREEKTAGLDALNEYDISVSIFEADAPEEQI
ncbi:MAG: DUF58 domain-containing protein [Anaerovoracaceae bacterium]|nr:DUF58 domain-containing protein [Bacillota bacterium]MDY2670220.1 DUF58 domain-containing protein [Anaerovoracaceae bacterium]